jgi:hypothetical protein
LRLSLLGWLLIPGRSFLAATATAPVSAAAFQGHGAFHFGLAEGFQAGEELVGETQGPAAAQGEVATGLGIAVVQGGGAADLLGFPEQGRSLIRGTSRATGLAADDGVPRALTEGGPAGLPSMPRHDLTFRHIFPW